MPETRSFLLCDYSVDRFAIFGERKLKYKFTKGLPKRTILYRIDEFEKRIQAEKKEKNKGEIFRR